MGLLDGQAALITGASSGIGRATALLFGREGAAVGLLARRKAELEAVAKEIRDGGGRAEVFAADLEDGEATRQAVEAAGERLGRLDVVVYAAGTNIPERALTVLSAATWDMMLS